ncbi:MAG TPA: hypothetical protein VH253_05810 [Phycisphaerae bacterium]|nr:hypothetical protein [Phycisphaerae bacterium]
MREREEQGSVVMKPLVRALEGGRLEDAARCVVGAVADRRLPEGEALGRWLSKQLGVRGMRQLAEAFGEYPCFVCRGGFEICDNCGGKGRTHKHVCEPCIGLGVVGCTFCGGSGWATVNFVPRGLRFVTVLHRIGRGRELIGETMRSQRSELRHAGSRGAGRKKIAAVVLRWNRALSILENGVVALQHSCQRERMTGGTRELWISRCATYARRADRHLRQSLHDLAKASKGSSGDAAFYEEISKRPEMISKLEHPFLRRRMGAARRSGAVKGGLKESKGGASRRGKRRGWMRKRAV